MNKFRKNLQAVLQALGLMAKAKDRTLTSDDWKAIENSYKETYGTDLSADYAAARADAISDAERDSLLAILNSALPEGQEPASDLRQAIESLTASNQQLKAQIAAMVLTATPDVAPVTAHPTTLPFMGPGTTDKHLFGIQDELFSMSFRHNRIAAAPRISRESAPSESDQKNFFAALKDYGTKVRDRYRELSDNGQLIADKLAVGAFTLDTSDLSDAGLGSQYVVRRIDALIARLLTYRSVTDLFPVRYGIQDRDLITNAFFSTVSQAWQPGSTFKGSMELKPEMGYVDDAMVKILFGTMEEIERMYIGYLNREGSDAMKWSMIEFALINIYQVMISEQNKRRIMGFYMKPVTGKPGHYLNAGSGVVFTLLRLMHQNTLLPHDDEAYRSYTSSTMLAAVDAFIDDVKQSLDQDQDLTGKAIYLNANHRDWWIKCVRAAYGKDLDFNGPDSYMNRVPDRDLAIKWVPNMGQLCLMFIQEPGNIQLLENRPGEMFAMGIDVEMEAVRIWSRWKEGCSPAFAGKPFDSLSALKANSYSLQQIFMNKPLTALAADATSADADNGILFLTGANTAATALTGISHMAAGKLIVIECGSLTNATTIAKSGDFANLTAAWTPTALGDYIMLAQNEDGNIVDLERCVNGVRTINQAVQPNIIGGR